MKVPNLILSDGQISPFIAEGYKVTKRGIKQHTARYGHGTTDSKTDKSKSIKRSKKRAVANNKGRENAYAKNKINGLRFETAKIQIEITDRQNLQSDDDRKQFLNKKTREAKKRKNTIPHLMNR